MEALDAAKTLESEISTNEQLLWAGKPRPGIPIQALGALLFIFVWTGFWIFWGVGAWNGGAPWGFMLFGTPFVLLGVTTIAGGLYNNLIARGKTYYGVTNRRVIVITYGFGKQVKSIDYLNMPDISLDKQINGFGSITITNPGRQGGIILTSIENAQKVYQLMKEAQQTSSAPIQRTF
jgi:hypothetical protein